MNNKHILTWAATILFFGGCAVGPKFKAPVVETPPEYLGSVNDSTEDLLWWKIFNDTTLSRLIDRAVQNNRNVGMALSRVEQARLNLKATQSQYWPSLQYSLQAQYGNETYIGTKSDKLEQSYIFRPTLTWELGLFGKVRRMAEADRNQLLATTEAARGVKLALIAEVATTYFTYLQYEYALQIAESTYASRKSSYELTRQSYGIGTVSDLDMKQAESALAAAEAAVPQYRRGKQEAMYALSLLMGENPSNLSGTHASLMQQHLPGDIPAGLPSDLLTRRPDIMEAYYQVAASNAQIGVAQAMRFPSIAITGAGGLLSEEFKKLFDSKAWMWSAAGSLTGPIFSFGANKRRVQVAREKNKETILNYEQSYLQAMNDVETALSDVQNYRQQTVALKATIGAVQHSYDLSQQLYRLGQVSYLNVLDAERTLFDAQMNYAATLGAYLGSYATLYKALGGGWTTPEELLQAEQARNSEESNPAKSYKNVFGSDHPALLDKSYCLSPSSLQVSNVIAREIRTWNIGGEPAKTGTREGVSAVIQAKCAVNPVRMIRIDYRLGQLPLERFKL